MARSIVLRFDSTCFDCGRSLSAGTTARWFGRGRVSCCGGQATKPGDYSPAAMPSDPPRRAPASPSLENSLPPGLRNGQPVPLSSLIPPGKVPTGPAPVAAPSTTHYGNVPQEPAADSELGRALQVGLSSQQAGQLGIAFPMVRLVVRLQSGARFIVRAEHVVHLCACISESMRDRIRDVMRATDPRSTTD